MDDVLESEWSCIRTNLYCANLTLPVYSGLCEADVNISKKCQHTCGKCDFTNGTKNAFTVAGLMDAILDMLLRAH